MILKSKKLENLAQSIVCKRPYILWTPFWNYLAVSLQHYCTIIDNYEPTIKDVIQKVSKNIKDDSYLINIWSNVWRYAIWLSIEYWYKVMAFEPNPKTFHNLQINTLLSDLDKKVKLFNVWLWNENWELSFATWSNCDWMAHIVDNNDINDYWKSMYEWNIIQVPVNRFDDLWIEKEKIEKTRLVIIDVEWYEYHALRGMEKTLKEFKDINIIVEIRENHKDKENTIDFMKSLWYSVKSIDNENWLFSK